MEKERVCAKIQEVGIIPAVRTSSAEEARFASEVVAKSGIPIVEITMTVPGAIEVISYLVKNLPDVIVGAGTLLDLDTARRCVDVGVQFLTSPGFDLEIVEFAAKLHGDSAPKKIDRPMPSRWVEFPRCSPMRRGRTNSSFTSRCGKRSSARWNN